MSRLWKNHVPRSFYNVNEESHPRASNVGALKKLLEQLPDDLRISEDYQLPVVTNITEKHGPAMLTFKDITFWSQI